MARLLRSGLVIGVMLVPAAVWAQTGTIAGTIRDTTGAVLPGVTVEASSPALIEKVRTAVSDSEGVYQIVDLRPGGYTVTFTLPGFSPVRREGIELTAGVTANVNAELRVGGLEETLTVTGQAPLVDVQNPTQHSAVTRTLLNELPTGRQFGNYAILVPGVVTNQQDVGGNGMVQSTTNMLAIHGSNGLEMPMIIDGMRYANIFGAGGGASGPYLINNGMVQEIAIDTAGAGAEAEVSGVRANVILKQGGNTFTASLFGSYNNNSFVMNNIDDALRSRFTPTPASVDRLWDFNASGGGPIKKDKVWFYGSYRHYGIYVQPVGALRAADPEAILFVPAVGATVLNKNHTRNENVRVTWLTSPRSTLSLYGDQQQRCLCANLLSATTAWEASTVFRSPGRHPQSPNGKFDGMFQATWNWTVTDKLLIELGETAKPDSWDFGPQPEVGFDRLGVLDSGTGYLSRGPAGTGNYSLQWNGKAIVTYVTGSHHFRVGSQWFHGWRNNIAWLSGDTRLNFLNGVPTAVTQRTTPLLASEHVDMNLGIFVQERYTFRRLTTNLGLRYDHLRASVPEQHRGPGRYVGPRDFPAIDDVPNWHDISPRFGLSWDTFGNGRTALKWSLGRYVETQAGGFPEAVNPMRGTAGTTTNRPWADTNRNLLPDCDLTVFTANGECGDIDNRNFGRAIVPVRYDPAAVTGWGTRMFNWEVMGGIEQELRPGLSVGASYHRRWFGNLRVFRNMAVQPSDFDPYCVTTPMDARLPGGGGQQVCGFFDISPASGKFGVSDTVITHADTIGDISHVYNGVDLTGSARLANGVMLQGGVSIGRTAINLCGVTIGHPEVTAATPFLGSSSNATVNLGTTGANQIPRNPDFCDMSPPFIPQVKGLVVYPLPWWGLQTSATVQSIKYPQEFSNAGLALSGITAERSYTSAEIETGAGGLGRPLAGGTRTATLSILPPGALYEGRIFQLDFRMTKNIRVGGGRVQPQFDIYNLFNDNTVMIQNTAFGPRWRQPLSILQGRTFKFGIQADF
jgi:carboxypeptidase family protein